MSSVRNLTRMSQIPIFNSTVVAKGYYNEVGLPKPSIQK